MMGGPEEVRDWQVTEDAHALLRAEEIRKDAERMQKAQQELLRMKSEKQSFIEDIDKITGKPKSFENGYQGRKL